MDFVMTLDGYELVGSSGKSAILVFRKGRFTITYICKGESLNVVVTAIDAEFRVKTTSFNRLEKALKYVEEEI